MGKPPEVQDKIQYASFNKRLKAFAFDYCIIIGYIILLAGATLAVIKTAGFLGLFLRWPQNPFLADLMAFITLILPVSMYFTLQEGSHKQATWGKKKVGIRVVNASGRPLTRKQALLRSLIKLLPWQLAHTSIFQMGGFTFTSIKPSPVATTGLILVYLLVGIYIVSALVSIKHRTPYDWLTGAYVIVTR